MIPFFLDWGGGASAPFPPLRAHQERRPTEGVQVAHDEVRTLAGWGFCN